jgi:hypothetical protein
MQQGIAASLPQPVHQTVHLQANPRRRTWQGYVERLVIIDYCVSMTALVYWQCSVHACSSWIGSAAAAVALEACCQQQALSCG